MMVLDQKAFSWELEVRLNEICQEHNIFVMNPQDGLYVVEQSIANSTLRTNFTDRVSAFLFAFRLCFEDRNYVEGWDNLRLCEICKQYECVAPATKCWRCREQEIIDEVG